MSKILKEIHWEMFRYEKEKQKHESVKDFADDLSVRLNRKEVSKCNEILGKVRRGI